MNIEVHHINDTSIAELVSDAVIVSNTEDGLDLLGNVYYAGFDIVILSEKQIAPEFFDLKNGMAGEILQKFSNYRVRLVIVGDWVKYPSKSLQEFIYESNKGRQVNFVRSLSEGFEMFSK